MFGCFTLSNEFSRPFPMGPQVLEVNLAEPITREVVTTEGCNARYSLKSDWLVLAKAVPFVLLVTIHDTKEKPQKQSLFSCFLPSGNREPVCMQGCAFVCMYVHLHRGAFFLCS